MLRTLASAVAFVLFIAYGIAAAFVHAEPLYSTLPLALAAIIVVLLAVPRGHFAVLAAGLAVLAALVHFNPVWLVYLPPPLINCIVALVFLGSLRAGRQPLIERIIHAVHGEVRPELVGYARALTLAWGVFMLVLAALAAALAAVAPHDWWWWFANVISTVLILGFFALEYGYRVHRFPHLEHVNPLKVAAIMRRRGGMLGARSSLE